MDIKHGERTYEVVAALTQRPAGARLSEIAAALGAPMSSVQRAVTSLSEERLVEAAEERGHHYSINAQHPAADGLTEFALRSLPVERAMDTVLRASNAVEFAGRDAAGYLAVLSPFAEPADIARLTSTLDRIVRSRGDAIPFEVMERSDLKDRLRDDLDIRERGLRMTAVKGSLVRTFRNPYEHGTFDARKLGRLHPLLPPIPRRVIAKLARGHGLSRIAVFGSAVRSDFRPDSDVDVMVAARPGVPMRLAALMDVQEQLERLLDRDVDVVNERAMGDAVRNRSKQEEVVLYGRP